MSSLRPARSLAAVAAGCLLAVTAATSPAAAMTAVKPPAPPLPTASSWVGGKNLIGTAALSDLPPGVPRPKAPKAASWLVADLDSRAVLAGRRVHVPLAPASTLKIFTALALAPKLDRKAVYTGQDADAAIDGTKVGIDPGSTYTVDDLLHGLLMSSGNDCANALGTLVGGTTTATALMQEEARSLGAFDTVARTTSGLDARGQVSSAYDLALAGSAALADDQLAAIMATTVYRFPGIGKSLGRKRERFQTQNHNRLLRNYPGSIGVKNGYTEAARGSFVGAATRDGHTYLAVVMRAEGSTWHGTADLLDWAFAHGTQARPVGTLVRPGELAAKIGPGSDGTALGSAARPTPGATGEGAAGSGVGSGSGNALRGAVPNAGSQLAGPDRPALGLRSGPLLLAGAALALVALAFGVGRRYRSGPQTGVPGSGRHRV